MQLQKGKIKINKNRINRDIALTIQHNTQLLNQPKRTERLHQKLQKPK